MNIIYAYSNCSDRKYKELFAGVNGLVLRADQKYHSLLIRGIAENGVKLRAMSSLPINRGVTKKTIINESDETEENVVYHYYKTVNLPFLRQITVFFAAFFGVLSAKRGDTVLVCDYQNVANAYGALIGAKIKKIPSAVIVMDLPDFLSGNKIVQKIYSGSFVLADGFVLLTKQMNEVVNLNNKPYTVIEGVADFTLEEVASSERFESTDGKKVIIYAGNIARLYGIQNLTEGFIKANLPDTELWIYGDGDYRDELISLSERHPGLRYMGIKPNDEVVYAEQRASLLVNPRPTAPNYTKYSFPSKNMEYMASGTPVLTTDLPGMPDEYKPYIYITDKESSEGIAEALKNIFAAPPNERYSKGAEARRYVLNKKSGRNAAQKLTDLLRGI